MSTGPGSTKWSSAVMYSRPDAVRSRTRRAARRGHAPLPPPQRHAWIDRRRPRDRRRYGCDAADVVAALRRQLGRSDHVRDRRIGRAGGCHVRCVRSSASRSPGAAAWRRCGRSDRALSWRDHDEPHDRGAERRHRPPTDLQSTPRASTTGELAFVGAPPRGFASQPRSFPRLLGCSIPGSCALLDHRWLAREATQGTRVRLMA
jgi:hypothetical protein